MERIEINIKPLLFSFLKLDPLVIVILHQNFTYDTNVTAQFWKDDFRDSGYSNSQFSQHFLFKNITIIQNWDLTIVTILKEMFLWLFQMITTSSP